MILKPVGEKILVRLDDGERTIGQIVLPDSAVQFPNRGVVAALGDGRNEGDGLLPYMVMVGDRILFDRYAGIEVTGADDGKRYKMMREQDIVAIDTGARE
jgi:chaperonin GroES